MNLSTSLRSLRLKAGWTQARLAAETGLAQPNLAAFESGARRPGLLSLARIAAAFGVEPGSLLGRASLAGLDRFAMDAAARALLSGIRGTREISPRLWADLQAVYFSKLRALAPKVRRRRPRLSPRAAERRAKAWLGAEGFAELTRRFEKIYPEEAA